MATYFHGNPPEIGAADGLQTLILMNPAYAGYADQSNGQPPPQNGNFVFLNNGGAQSLPHAPPQTQHFVGVPLSSPSANSPHDHPALRQGFLHPRAHDYGLYPLPADLAAARDVTRSQQGLSLSLSSAQPPIPGYGLRSPEAAMSASPGRGDAGKTSIGSPAAAANGANRVQGVLLSSKYLKATQELLDEVVNVGKTAGAADPPAKNHGEPASGGESSGKRHELTSSEKQEIQMKKAKLVNMLDEVDQRYMQYHQQMQLVISWFDQASGVGSAKTYTALALQTISKQFRCLKDAILSQIRAASRSLGEDEANLEGKIEGSRLKYVDNQIRQQRALQQLGMIQHNAWRPQRGLPERSVSVLRSWLFEHFLHPYPKDSDKLMLAKQTGLTRSQVSNWFINARVRLWKPMVEEMYTEEMKEHDNNGSENDQTSKIENNKDSTEQMIPGFNMPSEIECSSPKKMRISDMLQGYERQGGFGSYPMGELGADQFQYSGSSSGNNGVSLTLGLPHRENNLGSHQGFLGRQGMQQLGETRGFGSHQTTNGNVYENISVSDRKRFAAQLLPDFVA